MEILVNANQAYGFTEVFICLDLDNQLHYFGKEALIVNQSTS